MPARFVSFLDLELDSRDARFSRIIFTGNCSFAHVIYALGIEKSRITR